MKGKVMDLLLLLKTVLMGIVEGLTEFLPVSSTGHLIITGEFINFLDRDRRAVFEIVIQLGAILAVCWVYRLRLWHVVMNLRDPVSIRFVSNLVLAFLPAAVLGFFLIQVIKFYLFNPQAVAVALVVGGVVMLWAERRPHTVSVQTVDDMNWKDALKIGCAQALALIPGTSRSGATIIGGLLFGFSRQAATEFSFFLAIPTMFVATGYEVYKHHTMLSMDDAGLFAVGFVTAFISAMLAVKGLLRYVQQHDFAVFAWYRIAFGLFILIATQAGLLTWSGQ
jgi:undecaprenyl-diphosphatase